MADDFDLDRVINDPAYRRQVIARLNSLAAAKRLAADDRAADGSAPPPAERPSSDHAPSR